MSCSQSHEHTYTEINVDPACTHGGYIKYVCECGYYYTDHYIKRFDHTYVEEDCIDASCTQEGYSILKCTECGYECKGNYINPLGHTYVDYYCIRCGDKSIYNADNQIKEISLSVECDKCEINDDFIFKTNIGDGTWLDDGFVIKKENLKLFYYSFDYIGNDKFLGSTDLDEEFSINYSTLKTVNIYCILAHKNFLYLGNKTKFLKSNIIQIQTLEKKISTPEDLQNISLTGIYILTNDIDLEGVDFKTIDKFNGTLDGNGYCIKNLTINANQSYVGLFGHFNGTVKNLTLENVNITINETANNLLYIGGLAGCSIGGNFDNITVSGNIYANNCSYVGGIAGYLYKTDQKELKNLKNEANINGKDYVGGIFGEYEVPTNSNALYSSSVELENIKNVGFITGTNNYTGGLFGYLKGNSSLIKLNNCNNSGTVKGYIYVGGIAGFGFATCNNLTNKSNIIGTSYLGCLFGYFDGNIEQCFNENSIIEIVKPSNEEEINSSIGGFVGYGCNISIKNCTNKVNITSSLDTIYVGGIVGNIKNKGNIDFQDLTNEANIKGKSYVGGIVGKYGVNYNYINYLNFENIKNEGNITGTNDYIGGIFGEIACYHITIRNSSNTGNISGNQYVGGIGGVISNNKSNALAYNILSTGEVKGTKDFNLYFGSGTLTINE